MGSTLLDKLWRRHQIARAPASEDVSLLFVDRSLLHEETTFSFNAANARAQGVRFPLRHAAFADHYAPTRTHLRDDPSLVDAEARAMLDLLSDNTAACGIPFFGIHDPGHGIMHVAGPQLGLVQPGMLVTGSDSHTCTLGALGAYAFGIGQTELRQVFRTQTVWRRRPGSMRVTLDGPPGPGIGAKDVVLALIRQLGVRRAAGHVIEFDGDYVSGLSMDQRLTLCNMAIEAGANSGLIAPDAITAAYLQGKPHAPAGEQWDAALSDWQGLRSDTDAAHDATVRMRVPGVLPMTTWGTGLDQALTILERIPDPEQCPDPTQRQRARRALQYMGLEPGAPIAGTPVDVAFIGSCNSSRLEDLRTAARLLKGRRVRVPTFVVPGAQVIKRQAEDEGLARIFVDAGCQWREPGCSMCVGSNGDTVAPGLRCASSSPRNFEGRQGPGARTHVMSAAMAAAAAITGRLHDARDFIVD